MNERVPMDVLEIVCNVDDVTGEVIGDAIEQLIGAGALDAWATPIVMKKGRPAQMISLLCIPDDGDRLGAMLLRLTGSFGLRFREWGRIVLEREWQSVETRFGPIRIKLGYHENQLITQKVEFDDAREAAVRAGVPVREVIDAAMAAMRSADTTDR